MPEELHSDNAQSVTLGQERLYQVSAEVLLNRQNLAANLTGVTDPTLNQQADRVAQTQAYLVLARGGRLSSGEKEDAALLESER